MPLKKRKIIFLAPFAALVITAMALSFNTLSGSQQSNLTTIQLRLPPPSDSLPRSLPDVSGQTDIQWRQFKVKKGDNMSLIFRRAGEPAGTLHDIMSSGQAAEHLKHLRAGQTVEFGYIEEGRLQSLRFSPSRTQRLVVTREGGRWRPRLISDEIEIRTEHTAGVITDSLFLSGSRAGLDDATILQLAAIFGWDIDFALDIRSGDQFALIYQAQYLHGEKIVDGDIIAAEFINQGKYYRAIRYTKAGDGAEYYSPEGRDMRKAFLRTPVKFSRISSRFTNKRWHPVLKRWRSHRGIDYAAPRGTAVTATSDGKVAFKGKKGSYGKVIFLQHGETYTTVYGHLNGYAKGIRKGGKVKQGQIIGYVGSTGLATGPHLHYELRINGVHRNPLTVKLPESRMLAKKLLPDFKQTAQPLLAQLALISATRLAHASQARAGRTLRN